MRRALLFSLLAIASISVTACAGSRQAAICEDASYTASGIGDFDAQMALADAAWAERGDMAKLREAIVHYEAAREIDPSRPELYERLARAHYFLADGHLRFDEEAEDEMLTVYERGTFFAELGLGVSDPTFRTAYCSGSDVDELAPAIPASAIGTMYWYATNLGKWALASGILVALGNKSDIFAIMTRVDGLDSAFFHWAAPRYFGAYYTKIPFPGGDEELSKANFERSIAGAPNYLATRVLYADLLLTKTEDRAEFIKQLEYVRDAPADIIPSLIPENAAEKRKAAALLEELDFLFDAPEEDEE